MQLDRAYATIDNMVNKTRAELHLHREAGGEEEQFVERLVENFLAASQEHPAGAGVIHMALTIYRMVIQQEEIWKLHDAVEMRDAALKTLWEIEEL